MHPEIIVLAVALVTTGPALTERPEPWHDWHASMATDTIPLLRTSGSFVGLSVADLDASTKWYTEKLGLKVTMQVPWTAENNSSMALLQGGGLTVELVKRDEAVPRAASTSPSAPSPRATASLPTS